MSLLVSALPPEQQIMGLKQELRLSIQRKEELEKIFESRERCLRTASCLLSPVTYVLCCVCYCKEKPQKEMDFLCLPFNINTCNPDHPEEVFRLPAERAEWRTITEKISNIPQRISNQKFLNKIRPVAEYTQGAIRVEFAHFDAIEGNDAPDWKG